MIQRRGLLATLLLMALFALPARAGFSLVVRDVLAQGTVPPRPTLDPTQRPLTIEPIETIRATLSATPRQTTPTRQPSATPRLPTATQTRAAVSQTPTFVPSPTRAAATATVTATRPPSSTVTLSRPTLTPVPTPQRVPVTGGEPSPAPTWRVFILLSVGTAMLCFVAGVYVGLANQRRNGA